MFTFTQIKVILFKLFLYDYFGYKMNANLIRNSIFYIPRRGLVSKQLCYCDNKLFRGNQKFLSGNFNLAQNILPFGGVKSEHVSNVSCKRPGLRASIYNLQFSKFHTSAVKCHGEFEWQDPKSEEEVVSIKISDKDGKMYNVRGKVGDNLLYLAKRFQVEMEGACEASLACTTCHVYVDHDFLDLLPEATETEEDLLDQAPFLKENSRLGCQIILTKELDGLKLMLPAATKNFYVDGHKPTPH